jgi:hypothetical protein
MSIIGKQAKLYQYSSLLICLPHRAKYQAPLFSMIFNHFHFNILNPNFHGHLEMMMFLEVKVSNVSLPQAFKNTSI